MCMNPPCIVIDDVVDSNILVSSDTLILSGICLVIFLIGYLFGSIPSGLIITKLAGYDDIRNIGSGNIGATNVLRTGNKKLAISTLVSDMLIKGTLPVFLVIFPLSIFFDAQAATMGVSADYDNYRNEDEIVTSIAGLIIGLGAIIGHCYPIWLKFKGGKGVATALGVFLAAIPIAGAIACAAWVATFCISKTSSLSALIAVFTVPIVTFFVYGQTPAAIAFLITALIWWRHKDNIRRLIKGEEPKISFSAKVKDNDT